MCQEKVARSRIKDLDLKGLLGGEPVRADLGAFRAICLTRTRVLLPRLASIINQPPETSCPLNRHQRVVIRHMGER